MADLLAHRDWIAREVLADEIDLRGGPQRAGDRQGRAGAYATVRA
jgi:hypothetical protein